MPKRFREEEFEDMAAFSSCKTQKIYDHVGEELKKIRRNSQNDSCERGVNISQSNFKDLEPDDIMDFGIRKRRKSGKENNLDTMSCHKVLDSIMMFKSVSMDQHANFFIEQEVSLDKAGSDLDFMPKDGETGDVYVKKERVSPVKSHLLVFGKGSNMYNPIVIFDGKEVDIDEDGVEVSGDKDETIEVINLDDSSEHENKSTSTISDVSNCNSKEVSDQKWSSSTVSNTSAQRNSNFGGTKSNGEASLHFTGSDDISDDFKKRRSLQCKTKRSRSESGDDLAKPVPILTITLSGGKRHIKSSLPCQTLTDLEIDSTGFSVNSKKIEVTDSLVKSLNSYRSTVMENKERESRQEVFEEHKEIAPHEQYGHKAQDVQRSSNTESLAITRSNIEESIGRELHAKEKNAEKTQCVIAKVPYRGNIPSLDCNLKHSTNIIKHTASDAAEKMICTSVQKAISHTDISHRSHAFEKFRTDSKDTRHQRKDVNSRRNISDDRGYIRKGEDNRKNTSNDRKQDKDLNKNISEDRRYGRKDEVTKRNKSGDKRHGRKADNSGNNISEFKRGSVSDRSGNYSVIISGNKPRKKNRSSRQRKKSNQMTENDPNPATAWSSRHYNVNQTSCRKESVQEYKEKNKNIIDITWSIRSNTDKRPDHLRYHYTWNQRLYKRLHMEIPWDPISCQVCRSHFRSFQDLLQHVNKFNHCPFKGSYACNTEMYLCCYCPYESKTFRKILMHYRASHGIYFRQYGYRQVMIQALCRI